MAGKNTRLYNAWIVAVTTALPLVFLWNHNATISSQYFPYSHSAPWSSGKEMVWRILSDTNQSLVVSVEKAAGVSRG